MYQLIYTSAPRLLEAGKTGFGTLARSKEMPQPLVSYIERLSTFDRAAGINSLCFYSLFRQGALQYHVFSHVAEAGADYTGRTNHLAQHYAVEAGSSEERGMMGSTPAGIMLALAPLWHRSYNAAPSYLGEPSLPSVEATSNTGSWKQAVGSDECARWLAQPNYKDGACLHFEEVMDEGQALKLLHDAFLHMRNHGWGVGFSTATVSNLSSKVVPFTVLDVRQAAAGVTCPRGCPEMKITRGMQAPPKEVPPTAAAAARQPLQRGNEPKVYHGAIPSLPTAFPSGGTPPPPIAPPALEPASMPPPPANEEELTYFGSGSRHSQPEQTRQEQEGKGIPMPVVVGGSILLGALLAFALLKNDSPESAPAPEPVSEKTPGKKPENVNADESAAQTQGRNTNTPQNQDNRSSEDDDKLSKARQAVETAAQKVQAAKTEFEKLGDTLPQACKDDMQAAQVLIEAARNDIKAANANSAENNAKAAKRKAEDALKRAKKCVLQPSIPANANGGTNSVDGGNASCGTGNDGTSEQQAGNPPQKDSMSDDTDESDNANKSSRPNPLDASYSMRTSPSGTSSSDKFMQRSPGDEIQEGDKAEVTIAKECVEVESHEHAGEDGKMELDIKANFQWEKLPEKWRKQFSNEVGGVIKIYNNEKSSDQITPLSSYVHKAHIKYKDKELKDLFDNKRRLQKDLPDAIKTYCNDEKNWKHGKKNPDAEKKINERVKRIDKLLESLKQNEKLKNQLETLKGKLLSLAQKPNDSWQTTLEYVDNNLLDELEKCLEQPTPDQRIEDIKDHKLFLGEFSVTLTVDGVAEGGRILNLKIQETYKQPKQP